MRRSLDWKRHPLLSAAALPAFGVLVLKVGWATGAAALLVLLLDRVGLLPPRRPAQEIAVRMPDRFDCGRAFAPLFRGRVAPVDLADVRQPRLGGGAALLYAVRLRRGKTVERLEERIEHAIAAGRPETGSEKP